MSEERNEVRFGLWDETGKSGGSYLSGSMSGKTLTDMSALLGSAEVHGDKVRVAVFRNSRKKEDKHPDWNVVVSAPIHAQGPHDNNKGSDDDLPFN